MSGMDGFAAFMEARYAEAEALARKAGGGTWRTDCTCEGECAGYPGCERVVGDDITLYNEGGHDSWQADHIAATCPAHRLADIALKRAILKLYTDTLALVEHPPLAHGPAAGEHARMRGLAPGTGMISARDYMDAKRELAVLEPVARQLGTEFSGHPDYLEQWKP